MPQSFSLVRKIELDLLANVTNGENIPFNGSDVEIVFPTWESLTLAQQTQITTRMRLLGLEPKV